MRIDMNKNLLFCLTYLLITVAACNKSNNQNPDQNTNQNLSFKVDTMIYYKQPVSSSNVAIGTLFCVTKGIQLNFFGSTDANGSASKITSISINNINNTDTMHYFILNDSGNVAYYYRSIAGVKDTFILSNAYHDSTITITGYSMNWQTGQARMMEQAVVNAYVYHLYSDVAYRVNRTTADPRALLGAGLGAVIGFLGAYGAYSAAAEGFGTVGTVLATGGTLTAGLFIAPIGYGLLGTAMAIAGLYSIGVIPKSVINSAIDYFDSKINLVMPASASEAVPTYLSSGDPSTQVSNISFVQPYLTCIVNGQPWIGKSFDCSVLGDSIGIGSTQFANDTGDEIYFRVPSRAGTYIYNNSFGLGYAKYIGNSEWLGAPLFSGQVVVSNVTGQYISGTFHFSNSYGTLYNVTGGNFLIWR